MNRDDVLRIAKQAGMAGMATTVVCEISDLGRFAEMVKADFLEKSVQYITNDASREAAIKQRCDELQMRHDELLEQVECATITRDNMEGRLNGWLVKYAAMKDDRDTWQRRAEFSYQERSELERQRDNLLAFVERVSRQKVEPYFAKEAAYVIASVKGGAA